MFHATTIDSTLLRALNDMCTARGSTPSATKSWRQHLKQLPGIIKQVANTKNIAAQHDEPLEHHQGSRSTSLSRHLMCPCIVSIPSSW